MKKFLCLMLCLCLMATLFVSCNNGKQPDETTDGTTDGTTTADTTTPGPDDPVVPEVTIAVEDLEDYVIVYPMEATNDLSKAADALAELIFDVFDINLRVEDDYHEEGEEIPEYEILVGNTNRAESATLLATLTYQDYGYAIINNKLVFNAHDDYSASLAVADFIATVGAELTVDSVDFVTSTQCNVEVATYPLGDITIGGVEIADYTIVYPKDAKMERMLAEKIRTAIAEACGVVIKVTTDEATASGKEILVGKTNRVVTVSTLADATDKGYLAVENGNVVAYGNTAYGTALAVDAFIATFANAAAAETLALNITNGLVADTATNFSTMTFNVNSNGAGKIVTAERVITTIVKQLPDTVGLQECTTKWRERLEEYLGAYYTIVGVGGDSTVDSETNELKDSGKANLVLYKTEKFNKIESGTKWISNTPDTISSVAGAENNCVYTWVKLQTKGENPVDLMHVNTTLDTANTDVRQAQAAILGDFLYQNRATATVLTGDLNTTADTAEFKMMIGEDLNDSAVLTEAEIVADIMDFVLVHDEFIDVETYDVMDERVNGDFASNRDAIYVEYVIDYEGTDVADKDLSTGDGLIIVPDRDGVDYNDPSIIF